MAQMGSAKPERDALKAKEKASQKKLFVAAEMLTMPSRCCGVSSMSTQAGTTILPGLSQARREFSRFVVQRRDHPVQMKLVLLCSNAQAHSRTDPHPSFRLTPYCRPYCCSQ